MRRSVYLVAFLCLMFIFSGCLMRAYTIEKPRTDTEIQGNRGYISGDAPADSPDEIEAKTRTVNVIEFELGKFSLEPSPTDEEDVFANEQMDSGDEEGIYDEELVDEDYIIEEEPEYQIYTIKTDDTLQKISYKFYGTHKKWPKIYKENKDVIKSPHKIKPGKKIRIPLD